ncbi:anhydro-N-acetylmuramic acid kinase [Cupriavidus pauculus]|uniref:anhydro-N-acetylmuramic acid kinase n=1 Tax=Cupriavidus pauculus TaxID=82633 RepID=UPI001EE1D308|nr:anhydro-N-acetylmuramic acid kinase [Cupriavidus pauculus]GJG93951.1 anhydro-N-acetylmuramic acid kinase [Cupriavidus pauculus]
MSMAPMPTECFVGLMSGTSMDGADGVLVDFSGARPEVLAAAHTPFPAALREAFGALQQPGDDEIHREAVAANELARVYAECVAELLRQADIAPGHVTAIGAHGQTIRHRPGLYDGIGYTRQTQHPALLAELTDIDVVADFRSRDIAAGGQGAPLVPAVHAALFGARDETRVVCNIGGISNISILPAANTGRSVTGFDCGPGNALLDHWVHRHQGAAYDDRGAWGASGRVDADLLERLLTEPYFRAAPPKSTGRDLFHPAWLQGVLDSLPQQPKPADVQATLATLTATAIARDVLAYAGNASRLIVCGGGASNDYVMQALGQLLPGVAVQTTADFGVPVTQVEAIAFAWLARQCMRRAPGNVPTVTGAAGPRVLGAIYPR